MGIHLHPLLDIVLRSSAVYVFMIVAFRIFGKRELTQLSIADLVLIVLISNAVQNAMVGENTSLIGGLTAGSVLFILNMTLGFLMFRYKRIRNLVQSVPLTLISNGKIVEQHMKEALITEDELCAAVREHGVESYKEVSLAILEVDGNISIISGDDKKLVRTQYRRKRKHKTMMDM
ncbi:MAG: hypothetical protein JWN78_319 [Bacteroidota bacterium]|nr:hypothetical protein [Bacteroidota bacterium]